MIELLYNNKKNIYIGFLEIFNSMTVRFMWSHCANYQAVKENVWINRKIQSKECFKLALSINILLRARTRVCVCVDYICLLLCVVVYVIARKCVSIVYRNYPPPPHSNMHPNKQGNCREKEESDQ